MSIKHMQYIRRRYGVPAKRGAKVIYKDLISERRGVIVAARMGYLRIRFEGSEKSSGPYHPTWNIEYL